MKKFLIIILSIFMMSLYADESEEILDIDSLFDDVSIVNEREEDAENADLDTILLSSEAAEIGGRFNFTTTSSWYPLFVDDYYNLTLENFDYSLALQLYLDARPSEDFRVFVKSDISYPFETLNNGNINVTEAFSLKELFVDFDWDNKVFFKAGKQTVKWGVGYFFSPADVLSLTPIDPTDPEAEREGPVSLKAHIPIGLNSMFLYLIANEINYPQHIAIAPKFDFVIDSTEIGIGGFFRLDKSPKLILTATLPFFETNVFAEGVLSYGSDKIFIVEDKAIPLINAKTDTHKDQLFFNGTLGFLATDSDDETGFNYAATLQFFYNGEGYDDPDLLYDNSIFYLSSLTSLDLISSGKYYLAGQLSTTDFLKSSIGLSLAVISNLSDPSVYISPRVSYDFNKDFTISALCPITINGYIFDYFNQFSILTGITDFIMEPGLSINLFDNAEFKFSVPMGFTETNNEYDLDSFSFKVETSFGKTKF